MVIEDARGLFWPLLIWYVGLAAFAVRYSLVGENSFGHASLLRAAGPMLAGAVILRHPIARKAAWLTQPWPRTLVPAAKLCTIVIFTWAPAALLQLSLLRRLELPEHRWGLYVVELALEPGVWFLAGAALAVLCRSFLSFMGLFFLAALAGQWAQKLATETRGLADSYFDVVELLIVAVVSLACLGLVYSFALKRLGALAFCLLFVLWIPARDVAWSDWLNPSPGEMRIVDLRGPASPVELDTWPEDRPVSLCAAFSVEGVPEEAFDDQWTNATVRFRAWGLPHELGRQVNRGSASRVVFPSQSGRVDFEQDAFSGLPLEVARQLTGRSFDLRLEFSFESQQKALLKAPLEPYQVLEGVSSRGEPFRYWITEVAYDLSEGLIYGVRDEVRLRHLLGKSPYEKSTAVRLANLPSGFARSSGGSPGGFFGHFAFSAAQNPHHYSSVVEIGPYEEHLIRPGQEPPQLRDIIDDLELQVVEFLPPPGGEIFLTWEDVTIEDLICDTSRGRR